MRSHIAGGLLTRSSAAVIGATKEAGVSRLVWMSSFGVGHTFEQAHIVQRVLYRTLLRSIYADQKIADERIRSSDLEWTIVYPTGLPHGPAKGTYKADDRLPMKSYPTISRADVAAYMHRAVRGSEWIRRNVVVTD